MPMPAMPVTPDRAFPGHSVRIIDPFGDGGGVDVIARALATARLLVHDRGRVLADLACAIADGARVISDFRVMGDQGDGGRGLAFAFMIIHDHETWAPGAGSGSGTP